MNICAASSNIDAQLTEMKARFLDRVFIMRKVSPFSRLGAGAVLTRSLLKRNATISITNDNSDSTITPISTGRYCIS